MTIDSETIHMTGHRPDVEEARNIDSHLPALAGSIGDPLLELAKMCFQLKDPDGN